ncbi:MAG TPA: alpha/beta hydrolase, partial [Burkholderiales bacterium]|nr:alpha/beta hydrolase [Burkholderiales bacterium]
MTIEIERGLVKTTKGYIHYRAAGQGDAIVLLHINQQSSALYLELIEALAKDMRAVAIDYPSHGMSDHVSVQPSIGDYAQCAIDVMDALGIRKASALGEAVGAAVAIELAVSHAQRIDHVVLVNCPFYADRSTADRRHAPLKQGLRPSDSSGFPVTRTIEFLLEKDPGHAPMHPTQSWMDRVNVAQLEAGRDRWQALDALHQYDIGANLGKIHAPVMLLVGEHFYYVDFRDEFVKRIRNLQLHVIEGARFSMTWERADEVARRTI